MYVKLNKAKTQFQYKLEFYSDSGEVTGYSYMKISEIDNRIVGGIKLRMKEDVRWAEVVGVDLTPCETPAFELECLEEAN